MNKFGNLKHILRTGAFAVTGEIAPPKGCDSDIIRKKGEVMRDYVDAVNITDNQMAVCRFSSTAAGAVLLGAGVEPVVQMTTRDRNRLALQSDILGAAGLGIQNILCLTGDHQSIGNHPQARGVYDIDSIQLIQAAADMRDRGMFVSGDKITHGLPRLFIGGAANPFMEPRKLAIIRMEKKVNAGADFIQTQAVFNVSRFAEWMDEVRCAGLDERIHILAGVAPVKNPRIIHRMANVIPGMDVPEEYVARMQCASDPEHEGACIALEIIKGIRDIKGVHGIHIMAINWSSVVPRIVEESGLLPRPDKEDVGECV